MEKSVFSNKKTVPNDADLRQVLGKAYSYWDEIISLTKAGYPSAKEEWKYSGEKYGWSFRLKDKKRAIIYFIPHADQFEVAFVFGRKAMPQVLDSEVNDDIKESLRAAREYVEGRGVRILVKNKKVISDIKILVNIKLAN